MALPNAGLRTLLVRDFMAKQVVTFPPDMPIAEAVSLLVRHKYSGAPVVDAQGKLLGMLTEKDCLRGVVMAGGDAAEGSVVRDYMSTSVETVEPDTTLLDIAEGFMQAAFKRFPVTENGRLVGQISRFDVLRAIDHLLQQGGR